MPVGGPALGTWAVGHCRAGHMGSRAAMTARRANTVITVRATPRLCNFTEEECSFS